MGKTRNGIGFGYRTGMASKGSKLNLCDEYQAVYDAITGTPPSTAIKFKQNAFVKALVDGGVWAKLACIIPYGAGMPTAADALIWWNDPTKTGVLSSTAPTYVAGKGFTGNGTSSYIDTAFNPATLGGTLFTQNDNSFGVYLSNQRVASAALSHGGIAATKGLMLSPLQSSRTYWRNNSGNFSYPYSLGTNYLFIASRSSSSAVIPYHNKTSQGSQSSTSAAIENINFYNLAINMGTDGEFSTDTVGLVFFGSSLTQDDVNLINDEWSKLLKAVNAISVHKDFSETEIDTDAWTVTNPDTDCVAFSVGGGELIMDSLFVQEASFNTMANIIRSSTQASFGVWKFALNDYPQKNGNSAIHEVGLCLVGSASDKNGITGNKIRFSRYANRAVNANIFFSIIHSSTEVYYADCGVDDFLIVKVIVTPLHEISAYKWVNDAWVQIGETQTHPLGVLELYMASRGGDGVRTTISDLYIRNNDFNNVNPS